jgi:hypothetical protein
VIKLKHIIAYSLLAAMCLYFVVGDSVGIDWARYDFATEAMLVIFLGALLLRTTRDRFLRFPIKVFVGIGIFKLLFNIYGFIDSDIMRNANDSFWIGGMLVGCILSFLIYNKKWIF